MAAPIVPFADFDPEATVFGIEEIREHNAHRFEMELLDRIAHFDPDSKRLVGIRQVRDDEFWIRGHFPDQPILPGVLIMESFGQLGSFYSGKTMDHGRVMVFGGANDIRFRDMVKPGDRLLVMGELESMRRTAMRFRGQAWIDGDEPRLAFEGQILGFII